LSDLLGLAGLMLTVLATLAGVFRFLWSELKDIERRLRTLEADRSALHVLTSEYQRKFQEADERIPER
jgi:hypothetical protein